MSARDKDDKATSADPTEKLVEAMQDLKDDVDFLFQSFSDATNRRLSALKKRFYWLGFLFALLLFVNILIYMKLHDLQREGRILFQVISDIFRIMKG